MSSSATVSSSSFSSDEVGDEGLSFRRFLIEDRGESVDSEGVFLFKNPLAYFFGMGYDFSGGEGSTVPFADALVFLDGEL